jgi:hypothetical protein
VNHGINDEWDITIWLREIMGDNDKIQKIIDWFELQAVNA